MKVDHRNRFLGGIVVLGLVCFGIGVALYQDSLNSQTPPKGAAAPVNSIESPENRPTSHTAPVERRTFIYVRTRSDGARVKVDGEWVGKTPMEPLEVSPGRHVVEVHADGKRNRRVINLTAGRRKLVRFGL